MLLRLTYQFLNNTIYNINIKKKYIFIYGIKIVYLMLCADAGEPKDIRVIMQVSYINLYAVSL